MWDYRNWHHLGKIIKMDSDTALMTSTGSAICGAAAILGAEPVVKCEAHKTAVAVSTVVIFGTISMFLYPFIVPKWNFEFVTRTNGYLYRIYPSRSCSCGWCGQCNGCKWSTKIADQATITKMIRVMMLAPVLVIMSFVLMKTRKKIKMVLKPKENNHTLVRFRIFGSNSSQLLCGRLCT